MITNWIKLKTVIPDVADTISSIYFTEDDLIEWAFRALRDINAVEALVGKLVSIPVEDYKAQLPADLKMIDLIAYKIDSSLTDAEILEKIQIDVGMTSDTYYDGFNYEGAFSSEYAPLRLASSKFAKSVHCEGCINLIALSEHTYSIDPTCTITTSFPAGTICLAYKRWGVDSSGDYIVPDDESLLQALRSYVMMRIWEFRMNMGEEGAANLFMFYRKEWNIHKRRSRGNLKKPTTIDELENLRQSRNRLVPKSRRYYNGFSNQPEEDTNF